MKIIKKKINDIKPAGYNPRIITQKQKEKLKKSIKEFGYVEPIIWNKRTNRIVGGHQRYFVMKEMGFLEIDVVEVDLDEDKEKALNLALNKISGEWDEDKLIDLLKDIESKNEDLLETTGFSEKEIEYLLDLFEDYETDKEDTITIRDIKETKIREGDIFEINGRHKILCGDGIKIENYKKLFKTNKIDLVVTSPPYNINIKYSQYKDNQPIEEYFKMVKKLFEILKNYMNKHRYLCINIGDQCKTNLAAHYSIIMENLGYKYGRTIYWVKPEAAANPTITLRYPYPRWYFPKVNTETIVIYINELEEKRIEYLNMMLSYSFGDISGKNRPDKNEIKPINKKLIKEYITNVWRMQPETNIFKNHPAPYPIQLPKNCIRFYSLEYEIIFDPFLGSGTTIIAAEELNRRGYGMDLDPKYIELTLRRFKQIYPNAKIKCLNRDIKPRT